MTQPMLTIAEEWQFDAPAFHDNEFLAHRECTSHERVICTLRSAPSAAGPAHAFAARISQ